MNTHSLAGEVGFEMYFIERGLIQVILSQRSNAAGEVSHLKLSRMKHGEYFGEVAMFASGKERPVRTASVVAVTFCNLYCLRLSDFKEVVAPYPHLEIELRETAKARRQYSDSTAVMYERRPSLFDNHDQFVTQASSKNLLAPGTARSSRAISVKSSFLPSRISERMQSQNQKYLKRDK